MRVEGEATNNQHVKAHALHRFLGCFLHLLRADGAMLGTDGNRDTVRSKYSADPQVSIVQQVVTVTANRSQPWLSPNVFPVRSKYSADPQVSIVQ